MHPSQQELLQFFAFEHLPEHLQTVSSDCHDLAHDMANHLEGTAHGAELTAGLRHLLEAKDCFVRAALP